MLLIFNKYNLPKTNDYADTLNRIGMIYSLNEKYKESLEYYKESLKIMEQLNGKGSINCMILMNSIVRALINLKDYE